MPHNSYCTYELEELLGDYKDIAQETYIVQKQMLQQGFNFLIKYADVLNNKKTKYVSSQSIIDAVTIQSKNPVNLRNINNRHKMIMYPDEIYKFQIYYAEHLLDEGFISDNLVNHDFLIKYAIKNLQLTDRIALLSLGFLKIKFHIIQFGILREKDEEYSDIYNPKSFLTKNFFTLKNEWHDYSNHFIVKKRQLLLDKFLINEELFLKMNFFDFGLKNVLLIKYLYENFWFINDNDFLMFKTHKYGQKEFEKWQDLFNGILNNFCIIESFSKYNFSKIILLIFRGKNV